MRTMASGRRKQRMNPSPSAERPVSEMALRVYNGSPGSVIFVAPNTGDYRFYVWSGGGGFAVYDYRPDYTFHILSGGSGALSRYDRKMVKGEAATIVAGAPGQASTVTFADGHVVRCTSGGGAFAYDAFQSGGGVGGVATGGDINIDGTEGGGRIGQGPGGGTDGGAAGANVNIGGSVYYGGAGAPGLDGLRGGTGGSAQSSAATVPGGGGAYNNPPAAGQIVVVQRS